MAIFTIYNEMPLRSIKPEGWLKSYLENQKNGLTGYLEVSGPPYDRNEDWTNPGGGGDDKKAWWPYEQKGYWIDGMIRCGYLLDDEFLINKAKKTIAYVLDNPDEDGYLGPKFLKEANGFDGYERWPHAVFFRALMAAYSAEGGNKILEALSRHYRTYTTLHHTHRGVCNIEIMLWLYEKTGDRQLLENAVQAYENYDVCTAWKETTMEGFLSDVPADTHGVTYNEIGKLGALLYKFTGESKYLNTTVHAYEKIDRYHMLIDGVNSSSERLKGKDALDSHETCDIADYTWSVGYLFMITGDPKYADRIERACFNAAPGAVTSDFKALQYFSCPNQVIADRTSNHNFYKRGRKWMAYRPNPGVQCCPGEVNRIMPNYVARMWMKDKENGVTAALYGPSRVTVPVGERAIPVTIIEQTEYPFSDRVNFILEVSEPVSFTLNLRIPEWCDNAQVLINGQSCDIPVSPGSFARIDRCFENNDRVTLILPMKIKLSHWPSGGIGIERGPLVYALKIEEDWQVDQEEVYQNQEFPAWNLYAASEWNYALEIDQSLPEQAIEIIHKPFDLNPWNIKTAPIEMKVPARKVSGWTIERKQIIEREKLWHEELVIADIFKYVVEEGNFAFTPPLPDPETLNQRITKDTEMVTLVPYGCTKMRITIFPWISAN